MTRGTVLVLLATLMVASPAWADSASVDSVQDAGGGQIAVTYTVTSTAASESGYAGWFAYLAEDHSTRACDPTWANYLRHVEPLHDQAGSATRSVTLRPFFPRQIKLCVYLDNDAGERAVAEKVVDVPAGYGIQRSSGYNCEHFSRYSAQDYYWLYPGDPSGLDADNDGAACESNSGPGPGPHIPPEPTPAPPTDSCNDGIDTDGDGKLDLADLETGSPAGVPSRSCDQQHASRVDFIDNDGDGKQDWADADVNRTDGLLHTTRCDQQRPVARAPRTDTPAPVRLLCNRFVGTRGRNVAYRTRAPRRCAIWRENWAHYQALNFIKAKWRGWGKATARARVTLTGNSAYRERGRIKAYRLRRDCTGDYRVYTRVALLPRRRRTRVIVYRPDTCPRPSQTPVLE